MPYPSIKLDINKNQYLNRFYIQLYQKSTYYRNNPFHILKYRKCRNYHKCGTQIY